MYEDNNNSYFNSYEDRTSNQNDTINDDRIIKRENGPMSKKHKKSLSAYAKAVCCAILCGVIVGGSILGAGMVNRNINTSQQVSTNSSVAASTTLATNESKLAEASSTSSETSTTSTGIYTVAQIAENCGSSVVAITTTSVQEIQSYFGTQQYEAAGSGSGVIIGKNDTELLIATNNHVVEGSDTLTVCFNDDENAVYDAKIKGTDSDNDLAVVAVALSDIDDSVMSTISIATLGDSDNLTVGDGVVAIGNALGYGQSVTSGIVSAKDRAVTVDSTTTNYLIQTDAAINPGNSGGALFNMNGELIGINSAKYASTEVEGMGFAIPINTAKPILESLMNQETKDKLESGYGYLNIAGVNVTAEVSESYGLPEGIYVSQVNEGGAAANAGLQEGDIIVKIGNTSVSDMSALKEQLQYYAAGESVDIVVQRKTASEYEEVTLTVVLDNADDYQQASSSNQVQESETDQYGYDNNQGNGSNSFGNGSSGSQFFGY